MPERLTDESKDNVQKEKLFAAIRKLDNSEKAIISLYLEGYDNSEIANIIGITKNNTGVKLNRIKNKIKTILK